MNVVVPPNAPATVPEVKSSRVVWARNGQWMCVWGSMPPGSTSLPETSISCAPWGRVRGAAMAAMRSAAIAISASIEVSAVTTRPPRRITSWVISLMISLVRSGAARRVGLHHHVAARGAQGLARVEIGVRRRQEEGRGDDVLHRPDLAQGVALDQAVEEILGQLLHLFRVD